MGYFYSRTGTSSEELEKLDLVNLDIRPRHNDTFEDFLLSYFFDPLFSNRAFTPGLIIQLVKRSDKSKWKSNFESVILTKIYEERITEWQKKIKDEYLLSIFKDIISDSDKVYVELMLYKVLRTKLYHEIGKIIFRDKFEYFERLKLNLKDVEIDYLKISQAIKQIEILLSTLTTPKNQIDLETLILSISGLLPIEYNHIKKVLVENPQLATLTIINQLKTVFTPIYSKVGKDIEDLYDLIVPEKPDTIEIDSSMDYVKNWLIQKYFPYQNWLLKNNIYEKDFLNIGDSFSEWFYTNWEDIKTNSKSLVSHWLYKTAPTLENIDKINIVLIVDNLRYSYTKKIQSLFENKDITMVSSDPYLSMVPSETEISKKCLLSGKSNYTEIDQRGYKDIIEKGWIPYFNSANFIYIPNLDQFEKLNIEKGNTYFINYHAIDIILHQEQAKLGTTHEQQIQHLLIELVNRVEKVLISNNILEHTKIHIISDHGSVKFHQNSKNDLDVKLFKKKPVIEYSDRYIMLSDEEFIGLPDNLRHDCFFIDKNRFGLPCHCLCARRGNIFKDYSYNSYLHGGLLPEEVVIPHLVFEKVKIRIDRPILNLIKNKFRYRAEEIELQLLNPNDYPLENVNLVILNKNIDSLSKQVDWLNAKTKEVIKIQARFKKSSMKDETSTLKIGISFLVNKKPYEYEFKLDISMVSMAELKDMSIFDI